MLTPRQFVAHLIEDYGNSMSRPGDDKDDTAIGDDVTVVADGQSYVGKVAEKDPRDPQGRVKISFKGPRPARQDFKPDELRRDDQKPGSLPNPNPNPNRVPPVASRTGRSW